MMIRPSLIPALAILLGTVPEGLGAQTIVAWSCFELRPVSEEVSALPDSVQILIESTTMTRPSGPLPVFLDDVAMGQFVADGLVVAVPVSRRVRRYLFFRPMGDRMVGWLIDEETAHPGVDAPWHLEAHRFTCPGRDRG